MESVIFAMLVSMGMSMMASRLILMLALLATDLLKYLILGSLKLTTEIPYMDSLVLTAKM